MGVPRAGKSDEQLSVAATEKVASLFSEIGLPKTLAELGLPADKLEWTAEQSFTAQRLIKNNPKPLDVEKLTQIVKAAFGGSRMSSAA
jgi:alcohol dehydrogenase class IV